ncbi:hypothetical protein A4V12_11620 [Streptomyces noursei]|nr:hypothetical protein A4V12_11620 [Streptomyces noursei]
MDWTMKSARADTAARRTFCSSSSVEPPRSACALASAWRSRCTAWRRVSFAIHERMEPSRRGS